MKQKDNIDRQDPYLALDEAVNSTINKYIRTEYLITDMWSNEEWHFTDRLEMQRKIQSLGGIADRYKLTEIAIHKRYNGIFKIYNEYWMTRNRYLTLIENFKEYSTLS